VVHPDRPGWRWVIALSTAFEVCAVASTARAQTAQGLFDKGVADMLAGRFETGCAALAQSESLDPRPGTLFTLAECYARGGKPASAITRYDEYLALYKTLPKKQQRSHAERATIATQQRTALVEAAARLSIVLPRSAPPGTVVLMDGVIVEDSLLGQSMLVDPGEHVIVVRPPDRPSSEQRITLSSGEQQRLELELGAGSSVETEHLDDAVPPGGTQPRPERPVPDEALPPESEPPSAEHPQGGSSQRTWGYVLGGIGLAGLAAGGVTGAIVLSERSVIREHCPDHECRDQKGLNAVDRAQTLGLISTISFGVGMAGLTTGAILLLSDSSAKSARAAPQLVASAGKERALLGLSGRF
jgi:hypothetical protein